MAGLDDMLGGLLGGGGLEDVVGKLSKGGLGDAVNSWIGTGSNQPVSGDQVKEALGPDTVSAIAEDAGTSNDEAAGGLASMLPQVIDKLSPDGTLPSGEDLTKMLGGLLGK